MPADPTPPVAARSTAESLRAWSPEQRQALFLARPDLAVPPPRDSAQLAARAGTKSSLSRALDDLDAAQLAVLAAIADGSSSHPELAEALGIEEDSVAAIVSRLDALALIWLSPQGLRPAGELRLALAGTPPLDALAPPELATAAIDPERLDRSGSAAALEWVRRTELILEHWSHQPPLALRTSGLAVRDLKATAALIHGTAEQAALVIEVAAAARLVALSAADGAWMPSDGYDRWTDLSTAEQWLALARAWLRSPRLTHLIGRRPGPSSGSRDPAKPANALAPDLASPLQPPTRLATLRQLTVLPEDQAPAPGTGRASLMARLRGQRPRRFARADALVTAALDESAELGLTVADRITPWGRALVGGDPDIAVALLARRLPAPVDQVLFQADQTAVAPGPPTPALARELNLMADLESRGGAGVYRFSAASLRRAFDAGWSAAEVHAFLDRIAATPVPQPLSYLVDDVARSFGVIRVGFAEAFIRSDDEAALSRLTSAREAAKWGLRRIAPTVVVSTTHIETLMPRLRELGLAPVVEAPDGSVRIARPEPRRARLGTQPPSSAEDETRSAAWAAKAATAVASGDRAAGQRDRQAPVTAAGEVMAVVRAAIDARDQVWLDYVDQHGQQGQRIVTPQRATTGAFVGWDERASAERTFLWHRVRAVRRVEE